MRVYILFVSESIYPIFGYSIPPMSFLFSFVCLYVYFCEEICYDYCLSFISPTLFNYSFLFLYFEPMCCLLLSSSMSFLLCRFFDVSFSFCLSVCFSLVRSQPVHCYTIQYSYMYIILLQFHRCMLDQCCIINICSINQSSSRLPSSFLLCVIIFVCVCFTTRRLLCVLVLVPDVVNSVFVYS